MCGGGGYSSTPTVQVAPIAPAISAALEADSSVAAAGDLERKRRKAASGRSDTILTGGLGDQSQAASGGKQLLGQ